MSSVLGDPGDDGRNDELPPTLDNRGAIPTLPLSAPRPPPNDTHEPPLQGDLAEFPVVDRDSYAVGREVARGGMGRILTARDRRLRRPVAIKELLALDADAERRFRREALITARLQHSAIVNVHEAGRWPSGEPFYAMKMVAGSSLHAVISRASSLGERMALVPHVIAVSEALAYAHSQRVVHRDLKADNVLVGPFGETVVIDWGLAKDLAAEDDDGPTSAAGNPAASAGLTATGTIVGTPTTMAPEQAQGKPVDERADVYALGAILYHTLSGRPPYRGKSAMEVLAQLLAGPPAPLEELEADVPQDLLAIVRKAMARDPGERYPTALELAADLKKFQTGQLVGAHRYTTGELVWRWLHRNRAVLAVAAAGLLVLIVTGTASVRRILAERDAKEAARAEAVARADDLTLAQARIAVERDTVEALGWLGTLSPGSTRWRAARVIAEDVRERGIPRILPMESVVQSGAAFSPDGRMLAAGGMDGAVRVWDLPSASMHELRGHTGSVYAVTFSPDGRSIATGSADGTVRVWDTASWVARVLVGHDDALRCLAFSRDGASLVTACCKKAAPTADSAPRPGWGSIAPADALTP